MIIRFCTVLNSLLFPVGVNNLACTILKPILKKRVQRNVWHTVLVKLIKACPFKSRLKKKKQLKKMESKLGCDSRARILTNVPESR